MVPRTGHRLTNPKACSPTIKEEPPSRLISRIASGRNSSKWPDFVRFTRTWIRVSSHDWHVQPCCQRPDRSPPERRVQVPQNQSGAPRIGSGASSENRRPAGLSALRDEPFDVSANCRFLSTTKRVISVITPAHRALDSAQR